MSVVHWLEINLLSEEYRRDRRKEEGREEHERETGKSILLLFCGYHF